MISERMKPRRYMMIREDDYEALDDALEDNMHAKELRRLLADVLDRAEECSRCLLYTSPSPRDRQKSRMPSSA